MTREAVKLSEEAVKLSALGAKNLAALCLAMAKDNRKLKGKTKLKRLLTEGKELRVFDLKEEDVSAFAKEAKTYGILFSAIRFFAMIVRCISFVPSNIWKIFASR